MVGSEVVAVDMGHNAETTAEEGAIEAEVDVAKVEVEAEAEGLERNDR